MIPLNTSDVIARIESSGNPRALRFEPAFFEHISSLPGGLSQVEGVILDDIQSIHGCDRMTALMIYSTSWGLYQFMGMNIYGDHGYTSSLFEFCSSPISQTQIFHEFLLHEGISYSVDELKLDAAKRAHFAEVYNGDTTGAYAADSLATIQKMESGD